MAGKEMLTTWRGLSKRAGMRIVIFSDDAMS